MKSVLISIQPKWCELIASGKKTVEVRKTRPKIETPFKVYIYCTNTKPYLAWGDEFCGGSWETKFSSLKGYNKKDAERIFDIFNGKVIGEFVCDRIEDCRDINIDVTCLTVPEWLKYTKGHKGNVWGWHISNLVIYDKPKELGEFRKYIGIFDGATEKELEELGILDARIKRPPQSWCYVEEGAE